MQQPARIKHISSLPITEITSRNILDWLTEVIESLFQNGMFLEALPFLFISIDAIGKSVQLYLDENPAERSRQKCVSKTKSKFIDAFARNGVFDRFKNEYNLSDNYDENLWAIRCSLLHDFSFKFESSKYRTNGKEYNNLSFSHETEVFPTLFNHRGSEVIVNCKILKEFVFELQKVNKLPMVDNLNFHIKKTFLGVTASSSSGDPLI